MPGTQTEELQATAADLYSKGTYAEAAEVYRQLVKINPSSAQALTALGLALVKAGETDAGIEACLQAARIQPSDAEVRYSCGFALGSAKRYSEAIDHLDAVLEFQPFHLPAKQALVYSLLTQGSKLLEGDDPYAAERFLDRAHKLDGANPQVTAALLDFYHRTEQKGKATKLFQSLDDYAKVSPALKPIIDRISADPDYQAVVRQAAYSPAGSGAARPANAPQALQQVPCPNCRQMIMDFAALCPHCNFQIRAMGTFAGRDTGPAFEWQEVAYMILASLWTISAGYDLYRSLNLVGVLQGPAVALSGLSLICGLGLLIKNSMLAFICKILAYITLFWAAYGLMIALSLKWWGPAAFSAAQLAIAGFLVYLINYVVGD